MEISAVESPRRALSYLPDLPKSTLFAILGLLALGIPTLISMGRQHWTTEAGAQGPIIMATGIWLIWRERDWLRAHARPLRSSAWALLAIPLVLLYAFARIFGVQSVESATFYLVLVLAGFLYVGPAAMRKLWFPVFYLAFLIVPSGSMLVDATQSLKLWISKTAVNLLYHLGFPVAHSGAIIQVGQYQLLVADACAGLMSLFSLTAIGLFYVHLNRNSDVRHAAILMLAIVPLAIFANLLRVIVLVLLTYYAGSEVAQGMAHEGAGLFMFCVALIGMFLVDQVVSYWFNGEKAR